MSVEIEWQWSQCKALEVAEL